MSTLYELRSEYLALQDLLESGDYTEEELADTFEGIEGEIESKADGYAKVMREMNGHILAINAEIEYLETRREAIKKGIDRLKATLKEAMETTGKLKFKTDLFSFAVHNNGGVRPLVLDCEVKDLPESLTKTITTTTTKADKEKIRAELDAKNPLMEGLAHYGERGTRLDIK